mgnify:CR=1 FL=1
MDEADIEAYRRDGVVCLRGVLDPAPGQQSLGVLDVDVRRNAFGPQLASAEVELATVWGLAAVAFLRAPAIVRTGPGVQVPAELEQVYRSVVDGETMIVYRFTQ